MAKKMGKKEREDWEARYAAAKAADVIRDAQTSTSWEEEIETLSSRLAERMNDDELREATLKLEQSDEADAMSDEDYEDLRRHDALPHQEK
jgi:tRNA C32,U32 (ribose-2'-O)-methylase TrmJ